MTNRIRILIAGLLFVPFLVNAGQATTTFHVSAKVVYNCSMQLSNSSLQFCTNSLSMPDKQKSEFVSSAVVVVKDGYMSITY